MIATRTSAAATVGDWSVALRLPHPDELSELTELCLRSKGYWGYDQSFLEACRAELTIRVGELNKDLVRLAESGDRIIGVVQVATTNSAAHLEKLFVDTNYLSKGVGGVLLRWAIAAARSRGFDRLVVVSDPGAVPFYKRFGAFEEGMTESESIPGRLLPRLILPLG